MSPALGMEEVLEVQYTVISQSFLGFLLFPAGAPGRL